MKPPEFKPREGTPILKENIIPTVEMNQPREKFDLVSKPVSLFNKEENKYLQPEKEEINQNIIPSTGFLNLPISQPEIKQSLFQINNLNNQYDSLPILNRLEQTFKDNLIQVQNLSPPKDNILEVPKINYNNYKVKLSNLENKLNKVYRFYFFKRFKSIISKEIKHHQNILTILKENKKRRLFYTMKDYCENVKWNRYYIKQLLKMKLDDFSINNFLEKHIENIDKTKFFNYSDIKKMLENKLIENELLNEKINTENNMYHLKINIYTEKKIFESTQILKYLFLNNTEIHPNLEVEENSFFVNINDKNNFIPMINTYYSIFINIIFIDRINDMTKFIQDNLQSMNKFTYGLIYINYKNRISMENLMIVLDYATLNDHKKNFVLINYFKTYYSTFDMEDSVNNKKLLEEKYKCKYPQYNLFPLKDFNNFYEDILEYFNNIEFFSLLEKEIEIQKFKFFDMIYVNDYYRKLKFSDMIVSYMNSMKLFVTEVDAVTDKFWIKFFVKVILYYFN